jgi:hypothetical protein
LDYAANLLAAFWDLDVKSNASHFIILVLRSCLPKITHPLQADLYVFKRPLYDILDGWSPGPGDTLAPERVRVKESRRFLQPYLASALVVGEEDRFEWR